MSVSENMSISRYSLLRRAFAVPFCPPSLGLVTEAKWRNQAEIENLFPMATTPEVALVHLPNNP